MQTSSLRACSLGVLQGSILGPLLFSTYINGLPSICDSAEILMYADDTCPFYTWQRSRTGYHQIDTNTKVTKCLNNSCLTLNTDKTVTMFFRNRSKQSTIPNIYVDGKKLKNVDEFKYLGLTLDSTLTFKKHIKKLGNTMKYSIANFRHNINCWRC